MVGRKGESMAEVEPRPVPQGKVAMSIRDLYVNMPGERVNGLSLDVIEGEILGIGGLAGQGKLGISNGIMGLYEAEGEVTLFGEKLNIMDTREVLKAGVARYQRTGRVSACFWTAPLRITSSSIPCRSRMNT